MIKRSLWVRFSGNRRKTVTEPDWKEVYIAAKEKQDGLEDVFGSDSGPIGE